MRAPTIYTVTSENPLIDAALPIEVTVEGGIGVHLIRCGDVTADGGTDAVFTLASGGTAGDTGSARTTAGPTADELVLFRGAGL